MKKQLLNSLWLVLVMLFVPTVASAYVFEVDGIYYNIEGNNAIVTYGGYSDDERYTGEVVIPESVTYNGVTYAVVAIGNNAFNGCGKLTSVVIPNSVTSIGETAFASCSSLTNVTIGNSLTTISDVAFYGCSGLVDLDLPNSVTSIGQNAFCGCSGLANVNIPASLSTLGGWAFYGCALTEVSIPVTVSSIGTSAFGGCTGLSSLSVESGNKVYDSRDNCNAIIETATNTLIAGCKNSTIPSTIAAIGEYAFNNCVELTSITIPNSVTSIGTSAFGGCTGLSSLSVASGNKVYDSRDNCNAIIETATNTLVTGCKTSTIPTSVTAIGNNAFIGCTGLIGIDIPNSVNTIGNGAFNACFGLTSIDIPNSVTMIGDYAFAGCESLSSLTLSNSLTALSSGVFSGCTSLESINIPNSVVSIGEFALGGCTGLESIVIPNSVVTVADYAFMSCAGLKNLTIGSSVSTLGVYYGIRYLFMGCPNLTNITVATDNKTYDSRDNCNAIIETAGNRLILGSKNTTIPSIVTTIGNYAFSGNLLLTSMDIPTSVTTIEDCAFEDCNNLTDVYCYHKDPSVFSMGYGVFNVEDGDYWDIFSRRTLHVPVGSVEAYQNHWYWIYSFANIVEMNDEPGLVGDANGDGTVNISDINTVIDIILKGSGNNPSADVNGDGTVNISDINAIIAIILK